MIELRNISKIFSFKGKHTRALTDVSLTVRAGEIFGVIGASGAGKSTLIRCVNLLEQPDSGQVFVDKIDLTNLSKTKLSDKRRKIGMIFQHFNLLSSRTVFGNIAFPLELAGRGKSEIKNKVDELLELVGLSDKANEYPAKLSGGQKQRVAIARALANEPTILLCDEATSALDPNTTKSILKLLKSINRKLNLTVLLITHEMEVIRAICDKVAVIDEGELIESGNIEQIFINPRHQVTKHLTQSVLGIELPLSYQNKLQKSSSENQSPIIKIFFTGEENQSLVISELYKNFGVETKIINAQIESIGAVTFGVALARLYGSEAQKAVAFLRETYPNTEVLGYV
jgi:D-methionine transport system ATP-binding protein